MRFDQALIRKYDVNGPRYTSYPTAVQFIDEFDRADYGQALESLGGDRTALISLYLHIPFCATVCYYCACNRIITSNRRHAAAYLERLTREIGLHRARLTDNHRVEQLHFGGGTPTYLTNGQFEQLFQTLRGGFQLDTSEARDFSIEIDPRTVDPERIRFLAGLGLNRLSLGIQDFDPGVQQAVNRLQGEAATAEVLQAARGAGFRSISLDLIYGLPRQTPASFRRTLERVVGLDPDRLSIYSYAHLPARFKTQRQIAEADLPGAETKLELLRIAIECLGAAGYEYIGMDHFAKPTDSLVDAQRSGTLHRNFQGYTTHGQCDLIGLGVSAISSIDGVYCQNAKDLAAYNDHIDRGELAIERGVRLTADDRIIRDLIRALMCHFTLDIPRFERTHGISFHDYFRPEWSQLQTFAEDGLVELDPRSIRVTRKGRFLVRNLCMVFDRYLPSVQNAAAASVADAAPARGFSRAI